MVLDGASDSFPLLWKGARIKFKIFFSRKALGFARLPGNEFLLFGVGEWASGELFARRIRWPAIIKSCKP